jgi:hypothetical protein
VLRISSRSLWRAAALDSVPATKLIRFRCLFEPGFARNRMEGDPEAQGAHGGGGKDRFALSVEVVATRRSPTR